MNETKPVINIRVPDAMPLNGKILCVAKVFNEDIKTKFGLILPKTMTIRAEHWRDEDKIKRLDVRYFVAAVAPNYNREGDYPEKLEIGDEIVPFMPPHLMIQYQTIQEVSPDGVFHYMVMYHTELAAYRKKPVDVVITNQPDVELKEDDLV